MIVGAVDDVDGEKQKNQSMTFDNLVMDGCENKG